MTCLPKSRTAEARVLHIRAGLGELLARVSTSAIDLAKAVSAVADGFDADGSPGTTDEAEPSSRASARSSPR